MTIEEAKEILQMEADWDWEKFRREAAKDILAGLASWNPDHHLNEDVQLAVNYADALIAKLKKK